HPGAVAIVFNSSDNPEWDNNLTGNILRSKSSKEEMLANMNNIVNKMGAQILVDKVRSKPTDSEESIRNEYIEIVQLLFSSQRQYSRGPRIPMVGVSLGSLIKGVQNGPIT